MTSILQITSGNRFYISSSHQSTPDSPKPRTRSSKTSPTTSQPTPNSPMSCRPRIRSQTSEANKAYPKEPTPQASRTSSSRAKQMEHPQKSLLHKTPRSRSTQSKNTSQTPCLPSFNGKCKMRGNNERDEMSDDDSEDVNFNEAEQVLVKKYDDTSLDEESFSSDEALDEMELEFDTESRKGFKGEIIHSEGDNNLVVKKMSGVFNKGIQWSRKVAFDKPQAYKHFIKSCKIKTRHDNLVIVGSIREVTVISGLPAETSIERLEMLDDERRVLSFKVLRGEHCLMNYCSATSVNKMREIKGRVYTLVVESYSVDIPVGNTSEETKMFADTFVKLNLQKLAQISEMNSTAS
ncbi:hypothetical protein Cgig2_010930 [Carnegiea gigantea]|uniref:Uncharacterized protein n=1 Tax=Carnegiea gigantea TaxID=171969 RepID=A0A9Q1QBD2_9CARY|nr:hypothetical protein Cgig2_010930 [Carnegiea gigantea]